MCCFYGSSIHCNTSKFCVMDCLERPFLLCIDVLLAMSRVQQGAGYSQGSRCEANQSELDSGGEDKSVIEGKREWRMRVR